MTPTDPLWSLPATQIAALVRSGAVSATEVAAAALERLEAVNPAINAVVEYRPDEVLAAASRIDTMIAAGEDPGHLAGVPVTIKVNADQAGYATTNGLTSQAGLIAKTDSPFVASMLRAGALPLGRTNMPCFGYRWFTNNLVHGHTYNPRNRALTPGGSSGGAGAAAAAGIGAIAHGTDIAGSIRYPAYACGIHGLRPSLGRVPAYNASSPDRPVGAQLMAVSGPLARTVADLRLGFEVMAGPDPRDPWSVPVPLTGPAVARRAALCLRPDGMETAPELEAELRAAAEKLRDAGWQVDELDSLPPIADAVTVQLTLWMGDGYEAQVAAAEAEGDPGAIAALRGQRRLAEQIDKEAFSRALISRIGIARAWAEFLERYPVVLLPPSADLPFADNLDLKGEADYQRVWTSQMAMIGLPVGGMPSLCLATGATEDGTPLGIQLVSARYREDVVLDAAEAIEARGARVSIATPLD
ncbi:amidase family protein [Salipiger bermudensis]|uniref:amidase family protein n=1 Tax=Salipiger bermudensis TaxID=344736 RepID=UPI001C99D645|nr:amidase family protein [Salipiger bermudensis]MBY6005236.1 amidase family protein [Salipiger bermudensis]